MKRFLLCALTVSLVSCASKPENRTRFTDRQMRIMVDPASISVENYVRLQTALVQQQMWTVLDRKAGLEAVKKEQESLHRGQADRYEDKEKFARWGKLYGVGSVLVGHTQCFYKKRFFSLEPKGYWCDQMINLVDANSGEVVLGVEGGQFTDGPNNAPDWKEIVDKLADIYPKTFERVPTSERLETYKMESEEAAKRQAELPK